MIARTWARRVTLATEAPEIFHALRYLECDPEVAGPVPEERIFTVEPYRSYYRIVENGKILREQLSPQGVVETLHAELMILSLGDFPATPLIHSASLRRAGRRILLVGPKAGGKTTLALRLIGAGYEVEGDENVFVTANGVIPRPRGLRVKQAAAALLSHLADVFDAAGCWQETGGHRIYNIDPRSAGAGTWRIEEGRVDAVVLIRPNHGGYSSVRPVPPLALVREVMDECALPETGRGAAIAAIAKVIGNARGFDLSLGDLDGAVACLNRVFDELFDLLPEGRMAPQTGS